MVTLSSAPYRGMLNGQAETQYLQEMHFSLSKTTMPSFVRWSAPGAGQTFMHPASPQWTHRSFMKSHFTFPRSSALSRNRIRL